MDRPEDDAVLLLNHLYQPDDFLFIGDTYATEVKAARDWGKHIEQHGTAGLPFIIPNRLTGQEGEKKGGGMSRRCDAAVKQFRFALAEFNDMGRSDQLLFWSGWISDPNTLPVACLIDSGNKSIHAWVEVKQPNSEAWDREVIGELFKTFLIPLGVDRATKNPSRMSRLPGHRREKTGQLQRLLWLGPAATNER
jgi:hypothetical protein